MLFKRVFRSCRHSRHIFMLLLLLLRGLRRRGIMQKDSAKEAPAQANGRERVPPPRACCRR